jgi:hypothetical protein
MAEQLYFARHTKVFLKQGTNVWEVPVMDGFSFSQATNSSEVTLAEMESAAGVSRRGRTTFNDSYAPAEWSFVTYMRPFQSAVDGDWEGTTPIMHAIEEPLWANFVNAFDGVSTNGYTAGVAGTPGVWGDGATDGVVLTGAECAIDFTASNTSTLGTFELWFELGSCAGAGAVTAYKIADCVVNSASVDFDIDGIAQISWSGFGSLISDEGDVSTPVATFTEDLLATDNFIRNRLTSLTIQAGDDDSQGGALTGATFAQFPGTATGDYVLTLTGGSISFENNITFLTPETLCQVNVPIGHIAGARTIGGSFTAYLDADSANSGTTADLWEDLMAATDVVTNNFALGFAIGGAAGTPRVDVAFPTAHLEVPAHSIDDVVSVEMTFSALPSTISETDEATITYVGVANA